MIIVPSIYNANPWTAITDNDTIIHYANKKGWSYGTDRCEYWF